MSRVDALLVLALVGGLGGCLGGESSEDARDPRDEPDEGRAAHEGAPSASPGNTSASPGNTSASPGNTSASSSAANPSASIDAPPPDERTQFVLFGMDTTPHWHRRGFEDLFHALNRGRDTETPPVSYTLFIGTGSLQFEETRDDLTDEEAPFLGRAPRHNPVFDYAASLEELRGKAENIRRLDALGVEIGAHSVRHENGETWSAARWAFELDDHQRISTLLSLPTPVGFRAPFLGTNEALYAELARHGYTYDCSSTGGHRWPTREPGTSLWRFGIPSVTIPGRAHPVLLFDLGLEERLRAAARDEHVPEADVTAWIDGAFEVAVTTEFERHYRGARVPFLISCHGGFRAPTVRFMRRVCAREHVRCSTFREAVAYLEAHPALEGTH